MDEEKKAAAVAEEGSQDLKRGIAEWQAIDTMVHQSAISIALFRRKDTTHEQE